eukprot:6198958-Pleurochrysis_carterae.AAC.1
MMGRSLRQWRTTPVRFSTSSQQQCASTVVCHPGTDRTHHSSVLKLCAQGKSHIVDAEIFYKRCTTKTSNLRARSTRSSDELAPQPMPL